jgi:hypothetical protein
VDWIGSNYATISIKWKYTTKEWFALMTIAAIIQTYNNESSIGTQVHIAKKYASHVTVVVRSNRHNTENEMLKNVAQIYYFTATGIFWPFPRTAKGLNILENFFNGEGSINKGVAV